MEHRDLPIKTSDEDKLNFSDFASKIAKGILNYNQEEALIFSIEGEWGSGKTSLINLIKNELLLQNELITTKQKVLDFIGSDQEPIKFMHFNPWLMTDIEQVIKLFFSEFKYLLENKNSISKKLDSFEDKLLVDNIKFKVPFAEVDYKIDNTKDISSIKYDDTRFLYQLRHSFASIMISKGEDITCVSQMMGHENIDITLKVYTHFYKIIEDKNKRKKRALFLETVPLPSHLSDNVA